MSTFAMAIRILTGRPGGPRGDRRRTSRRFLSDYVPERFEPRIVPATVNPHPAPYSEGLVEMVGVPVQVGKTVTVQLRITDAGLAADAEVLVGIVSYTNATGSYADPGNFNQKYYDSASAVLSKDNPLVTLTVELGKSSPGMTCQVDVFVGKVIHKFAPGQDDYNKRIIYGDFYNCGCQEPERPKGNNGIGNGLDGQPPGDPKPNDLEGDHPGSPGWGKHK